MRTDDNHNPAAFTTDIARQAGLVEGKDYVKGTPFPPPSQLFTAKLLGDPVALTIRVIDAISYFTRDGNPRWVYNTTPKFTGIHPVIWHMLTPEQKRDVVGFHYLEEGGVAMRNLFPNYGRR